MSILDRIQTRGPRPARKHRAVDYITALEAEHAAETAKLRKESRKLLRSLEFFQQQDRNMTALEQELAAEKRGRADAEAEVEARGRWITDLERKLAEANRRLDIGVKAEHVIAKTQEIPVVTRVVPLHLSPMANPAHVPAWAVQP